MGGRMVLAALLGGLVIFIWGALSHMVLQLGDKGMGPLPGGEAQVAAALKENVKAPGIYWIPGGDMQRVRSDEAYAKEWEEKLRAGPYALMVVKPDGSEPMSPMQLAREFATSVGMALIAVFLIVAAGGLSGMFARIAFCVLLALFGYLQHDVRFWNWYGFPPEFTIAQLIDKVVAGVLLGIVISLVIKRR